MMHVCACMLGLTMPTLSVTGLKNTIDYVIFVSAENGVSGQHDQMELGIVIPATMCTNSAGLLVILCMCMHAWLLTLSVHAQRYSTQLCLSVCVCVTTVS